MNGLLRSLKGKTIAALNLLPVSSKIIGTPRCNMRTSDYLKQHPEVIVYRLKEEENISINPPTLNVPEMPVAFSDLFRRSTLPQYILSLPNARVWGANGAVVTKEDVFLNDVSREFGINNTSKGHSIFRNLIFKKVELTKGTVAVCTTAGANVYYHWMLDVLPRIMMLKEAGLFEKVDYFVLNYTGLPFQKQTLSMLGIEENRVLTCNNNWDFHIEATTLLVPTLPSKLNEVNGYECGLIKKYLYPDTDKKVTPKRIYISRKKAGTRTVVNEGEVLQFLQNFGFEEIVLETKTVGEQIALFSNAEMIAGPHGSAFMNIVFCRKEAILLDIIPDSNIVSCFYNLAAQCGVHYFGFIDKSKEVNSSKKNDNVEVDMVSFSRFFQSILAV